MLSVYAKYRRVHECVLHINVTTKETAHCCDRYIYAFDDTSGEYRFYVVDEVNVRDESFRCRRLNVDHWIVGDLNLSDVGLFEFVAESDDILTLNLSSISGKAVKYEDYIVSVPSIMLKQD